MKRLLFLLSTCPLFAEVYYNTIADRYSSPYVGAADLVSAHRALQYTQDWLLPPSEHPQRKFWPAMERFSELFFFWDPLNSMGVTTQHEVFGHGYRIRLLHNEGAHVKGYKIDVPFPYGAGGGLTRFEFNPHQITAFEDLAVVSGGVEASAILANRIKLQWLQQGTIDARESTFYTGAEQDLSEYIWITSGKDDEFSGDIAYYVRHLNKAYPRGHLTVSSLKKQALVNLLDPFTFYSVYAWWRFVVTGKKTSIPMIPLGSYKYLPSARLGLTPFGPEYYLDNFLVKDQKPIYFYLRAGGHAHQIYLGLGIEHAYLWNLESLPWGLRLDTWYQPHTAFRDLHYSVKKLKKEKHFHTQPHNPTPGIALSAIGHKKLWPHTAFYFQLGGKTIGYLEGESLQPSLIARIGLTFW